MSDINCNEITSVLKRGGTDQTDRSIPALNPDSFKLQGFGIEEWMQFAYNFAKDVNFFATNNDLVPDGDWQAFFKDNTELTELLNTYQESNKLTPHLTLFICFLKLLELSSEHFNKLTKRHLDFYYSEVLQISKLPEESDKAYVIFELAKNMAQAELKTGTELDGGKDATGKKRVYTLTEDLVANRAKVVQLKNVYNDPDNQNPLVYPIKGAPVANSYNGNGEAFPGEDTSWRPFGYNHLSAGFPELPDAKLGFAVSSSTLSLSEGARNVIIDITFAALTDSFLKEDLRKNIDVFYSGAKGWVGPLALTDSREKDKVPYKTEMNHQRLSLGIYLDSGMEAVTNYDKAVHGEQFSTQFPVFRFLVKTGNPTGYSIYKNFCKQVSSVNVKVSVEGMHNLALESDTGVLNAKKPFYPFTTYPVKGSSFSIYNEEIFSKKWKNIDVSVHWKNTPDNFNDLYRAYDKSFLESVAKDWFTVISDSPQLEVSNNLLAKRGYYDRYNSIVTGDNYFQAKSSLSVDKSWETEERNIILFKRDLEAEADEISFNTEFSVQDKGYVPSHTGPLRLTLQQSFLQDLFPRIYALAIASDSKDALVPNQPYIPFADEVTVDYVAEISLTLADLATMRSKTSEEPFEERTLQLFHEHPYGQSEEHLNLKRQFDPAINKCYLTPTYCKGGELYIGLGNVQNLQQIALLIQVLEGTENPLTNSFTGDQQVTWDILCSNFWKPVTSPLMQVNQIDNFLKSGIVKFAVPKEATSDNTLLPEGLFWVRAKMFKQFDAVCKVLSIDAQAVMAAFDDRGNELSHLEKGIPAKTISKLVDRSPLVKTITQPYNSFGGKPIEADPEYYRRVSERLRHKNRAVTLWDYEQLILQQFPSLFKVKCLNHTCDCSYVSAGNIVIVVIPDTIRKNVFDIFQPRVSKALLNEIDNYVSQLNSLHVKTEVVNPNYEEVLVSLKVKFYDGLDIPLYVEKLNTDITRFLSPWAFEGREDIQFGVTLHRTVMIDYIEKLNYVDYLQDVKLIKGTDDSLRNCTPSTPKSILVSAKRHIISTDIITCTTTTNPSTEICQL